MRQTTRFNANPRCYHFNRPKIKPLKQMTPLILASTSRYRRELLSRLGIDFTTENPNIDEIRLDGEAPDAMALRLAAAKAAAVGARHPDAIVIGSDQVAHCNDAIFGKPGSIDMARDHLRAMRGREVSFFTALCVINTTTGRTSTRGVKNQVGFRHYSDAEIDRYLANEPDAINCAGSAKSEGLGITLLSYIRGDDPNALIGLPLIVLAALLRDEGLMLP